MFLLLVLSLLFSLSLHAMQPPEGQEMNEEITLEEVLCDSYSCLAQCGCLDDSIRVYVRKRLEIDQRANSADRVERNWGQAELMTWNFLELGAGFFCSRLVNLSETSPQAACMCGSCMGCCAYVLYKKYPRISCEEAEKIE